MYLNWDLYLKESLKIDYPKARKILTNLVDVTLSEPRTDVLNEIRETIDIIVEQFLEDPRVIDQLTKVAIHDYSTSLHLTNCMLFAFGFAYYKKFDNKRIKEIGLMGLLHDVGKVKVPDYLLQAARKLSTDEFEIIKKHPVEGYKILKITGFNENVQNVALQHHEKLDGSGYPYGIKKESICYDAQIIGIIDIFEALTNFRPYKKPIDPLDALKIIKKEVESGKLNMDIFKEFSYSVVGQKKINKK